MPLPPPRSLAALRPDPRTRGVVAMLATSMLASRLTIPVALSALQSPDNLDGLLLALQASAAALLLAVLVGRTVARDAAREQRS